MNIELNDAYKELENRLNKLEDEYLTGKIDAASYSNAVIITQLERRLLPYHEELLKFNIKLSPHIGLIIGLISDKQLTPKEEQQVKRNLKKIKDIANDLESSKAEREQDIADIFSNIEGLLLEIVGVLRK